MSAAIKLTVAEIDYQWFRAELRIARREHQMAAQKYGALTNRRAGHWNADRAMIEDAEVELEETARMLVYAEALFAIAAHDVGGPK